MVICTIKKQTLTFFFKSKFLITKCSAPIEKCIWNPKHPLQIASSDLGELYLKPPSSFAQCYLTTGSGVRSLC